MTGMFSRRFGRAGLAVLVVAVATSGCAFVSRVSDSGSPTSPLARPAQGSGDWTSLSTNGQFIAFQSPAPDILPNDNNGATDIFVRDRTTGAVEAASVSSSGTLGSSGSFAARISPDGRFVVFESAATNLVLNDTNGQSDAFLRDRQAKTTVRISVGAGGAQAVGGPSGQPSVSADGRYVEFISSATNLVAGDTNNNDDAFVRDLQTGTTTRVSVGAGAVQSNGTAQTATMSGDGRYVAFNTDATNLVAGDTNGSLDVFVRDRTAATTSRVSVATGGAQTSGTAVDPTISTDGRYVAFTSDATNLVAGDTNGTRDIFLRDRTGATTTRASVATGGAQANGSSYSPALSADGRYVTFTSAATSLGGFAIGTIYRRDRTTGTTIAVSRSTAGDLATNASDTSSVSGDGSVVGFTSSATNLVPLDRDRNAADDVFDRVIATNTTELVSRHGAFQGNGETHGISMSLDGRYVAFASSSSDLVPNDTNQASDVFVRDTLTGAVQLVSESVVRGPGSGTSDEPSISSDGRFVAFTSFAEDLISTDRNAREDVFLRDLANDSTRLISLSPTGMAGNFGSFQPTVSADGSVVAFTTDATNFIVGDSNMSLDVFARDWANGTTTPVSITSASGQSDGTSQFPSISPDGRYVTFSSQASNLVSGDTNATQDVFLRDRTAGTTTRLSVTSAGAQSTGSSNDPRISADGRYVAFSSFASNLVAGDTNATTDVFVRDRQNATTTRVSVGAGGAQSNAQSHSPGISADGRYVAFVSYGTNLVSGDTNNAADVFVRDQVTGRTTRISTDQNLAQANDASPGNESGTALGVAMSVDGRYVGFVTQATNIVTPDVNGVVTDLVIRAIPVPTITSATPTTVARGASATITVNGTYFLPGVNSYFGGGITVTNTNRVSESQVKFTFSVAVGAATGNRNVIVFLPGTGAGTFTGAAAQFTLKIA